MRFPLLAVTLATLLAACSGGSETPATSEAPATSTPTTPSASPTPPSATPTPTSSPDGLRIGPPITNAAATASIPAERDGRHLSAVAGYGDEVLLDAQKDVPYLPGDIIGQGAKGFDQQFLLWNPATGAFRDMWANQSERNESVLDIDGDWVLSQLYRLNPGVNWILRLRNLVTGEVRDIDAEDPEHVGRSMAHEPQIGGAYVAYTLYSYTDSGKTADVVLYSISSKLSRSLTHVDVAPDIQGWGIANSTTDGTTVAWTKQDTVNAPLTTVIYDLPTDSTQSIRPPGLGICGIVSGTDWLACTGPTHLLGPNEGGGYPGAFAYRPTDGGKLIELSRSRIPEPYTSNTWVEVHGSASSPASAPFMHNLTTLESREFQAVNAGASPRLVDGWFTWIDWTDSPDGRRNFAASTLYVLRLD